MKNKRKSFEESKWEKFVDKVKEKRFYIVLLCCIMAVSATYFVVDSFQKTTIHEPKIKTPITVSPTPLPDLTKNFPKEDNKESKVTSTSTPTAKPQTTKEPTPKATTPKADSSNNSSNAKTASTGADVDYQTRKQQPLLYPVSGEIITPHSEKNLIYSKTLADWRTHEGIDIKATIGTEVKACDDGIIEKVYTDDFMGITIVIDHLNGLKSIYSNLSSSSLVQQGAKVKRGDVISAVGDTAIYETAEVGHLHFEVTENEKTIDPFTVLEK